MRISLLLLLGGFCSVSSCAQSAANLWGLPVTGVQLECDCNLKIDAFAGAVAQPVGQPLDAAKVSETLRRLYASGKFSELRAEGRREGDGVRLLFVARAQYFVGIVAAEGNPGAIDSRAVVTASRLRLGHPLTAEDLEAANQRLHDLLASNGYYRAQVSQHIARNRDTLEADVTFIIKPGLPARVSTVEFPAHAGFPAARLAKVSGWGPHLYLTAARVERGLYRLRQFYLQHDRLQVNANIQQRIYDAKTNTERVRVAIDPGPVILVHVKGASISKSELQNLLPLYHDGITDDAALVRSARLLQNNFQEHGYFSAAVKGSRAPASLSQDVEILFRVELGSHGDFAGYGVKGNRAIPSADLMASIAPPEEGLLPPSPTYSQDLVEQKIATLLNLYQVRGYLDVRITPAMDDNFQGSGRRYVTLTIDEGALTTVHTLTLVGVGPATESKLWPALLSKPTRPYSLESAGADRDTILDYLADHGFSHAAATWHVTSAKLPHQVNLEFQVAPGAQDHIQRIVVLGNEHVRNGLVNRELLIHPHQPLSQSAVLDSQRRLYNLGIFSQVQITPQEESASNTEETVLVGLEESRRWTLGYGGGFEVQRLGSNTPQGTFKASPRGSLSLTRLDVGGRGQTFSMGGRLSYLDTGADAGYLIPRLFNRDDLDLRIKVLTDLSREVLTFTENLQQASIGVEKHFSSSSILIGQYSFERVRAEDISNRVSPAEAALYSQPAIVGMAEGTFIGDRRDDALDATRGSYTLVNAGVAWKDFGSQSDFVRFNGKNSTYYTLTSHLVLARLTQFGLVSPFGAPYSVTEPAADGVPAHTIETNSIPLPERFFMGGSQSMRGFSINQAGPRDPETGYPIGGNALFLNSVELRTFFAQRRLGVVFFEDAGNVYSTVRRMRLFKFTQSSPEDFDYTSHAAGVGLRFKTPVGPLSFDLGYNLNPPKYNVVTTTAGGSNTQVQRLANFQFFLSFGQSF